MATLPDWFPKKGEWLDLSIAVLVLAFAFSFRFPGTFSFARWFGFFVASLVLVLISVFVHEAVHRAVAEKYQAVVTSKVWLAGLVATIVLVLLTNGYVVFAAPWAVSIVSKYFYRPGKHPARPFLGPYERAIIAMSGPLANFGLALIAKLLVPVFGDFAILLMIINLSLAVFNLFPFFTLLPFLAIRRAPFISKGYYKEQWPYIEGEFVFFGSRVLWAFMFFFVVLASLLLFYFGALSSLITALFSALMIWIAWHYFFEGAKPKPAKPI